MVSLTQFQCKPPVVQSGSTTLNGPSRQTKCGIHADTIYLDMLYIKLKFRSSTFISIIRKEQKMIEEEYVNRQK